MKYFEELQAILQLARPFGTLRAPGIGESQLHRYLIDKFKYEEVKLESGEVIAHRRKIGNAPVMFSAHSDTVDARADDGRKKTLATDSNRTFLTLARKETAHCLGADDGAGIWLQLQMIRSGIPGEYWIWRGEEAGCVGSGRAAEIKDQLTHLHQAVAVDRAGTGDVITHQRGSRCASDEYAKALAAQLGEGWAPCRGVYTDTAELVEFIPECTNLSVGYRSQHTSAEVLDLRHLEKLIGSLRRVRWANLPIIRTPEARPAKINHYQNWESWRYWLDDDEEQSERQAWQETAVHRYEPGKGMTTVRRHGPGNGAATPASTEDPDARQLLAAFMFASGPELAEIARRVSKFYSAGQVLDDELYIETHEYRDVPIDVILDSMAQA